MSKKIATYNTHNVEFSIYCDRIITEVLMKERHVRFLVSEKRAGQTLEAWLIQNNVSYEVEVTKTGLIIVEAKLNDTEVKI